MVIVKDAEEISGKFPRVVLTIGNFDGVHRGHQALMRRLINRAGEVGGTSAVFTFDPHPLKVLAPEKCPPLINLPEGKMALFNEVGLDLIVNHAFSEEFALQSPRDFVELTLCRHLRPVEIYVGSDFRFGKGREGNVEYLRGLGDELGFRVIHVEPITYKNVVVSSTLIRELLIKGRVEEAADLLGRPYAVSGTVVEGDARGRKLGFPTANIQTRNEIIPRRGVYAVKVTFDGETYKAITNVGLRPTFKKDSLAIEAFIFDFSDDIYGCSVELEFIARLRDEKAFSSPQELVTQIERDVAACRKILS